MLEMWIDDGTLRWTVNKNIWKGKERGRVIVMRFLIRERRGDRENERNNRQQQLIGRRDKEKESKFNRGEQVEGKRERERRETV